MRPAYILKTIGIVLLIGIYNAPAAGQRTARPEEVEAAYLFQFGKFVEFPQDDASHRPQSFAICVLGRDPFGAVLTTIVKGEAINGLSLQVVHLSNPKDASRCRLLFIGSSEENRLSRTLDEISGLAVLTVSDIPNFAGRGGMVGFLLVDNNVRFEVNLANSRRAGLMLSSQLLKVAVSVKDSAQAGGK